MEEDEINSFFNNYSLGDQVKINYEDIRITNNTTENTFNYKKYLIYNKIYKVLEITKIELIKENKNIFYYIKDIFYKRVLTIYNSFPYLNSLILGNNDNISDDVRNSYQNNGVSHLFAISGTHITIFISILIFILKKIKIKENLRYIIIVLFLLFYLFLTNFSISVLRASIFTILCIINKIFYFNVKPINLNILTLSIILFMNPLNIFNIGLQYSFLISSALIYMSDYINSKNTYFKKLFFISFISFIMSVPITITNFYELNFLSIFYNMFFVPYVTCLILPITLLTFTFPFLDKILYYLTLFMEKISLLLNNFNFLKVIFYAPSLLITVLYLVSTFACLYYLKKGKKLVFLILIFILFINGIWPMKENNYLTYIDVNQGDSILLSVNGTVTLIDTGGKILLNSNDYTYNTSKYTIIPFLKSKGIKKIDNLILTHGDADHMKESIYILNNFKVKNIYLNGNIINYLEQEALEVAKNNNVNINYLKKDDYINLNGIKLISINDVYEDENDSSIVLYTVINNYKLLFLGDISKEIELKLIKEYDLKNVFLLKVAHHGSKTSSAYNFLREVNPSYSIISVGYDNMFNHPHYETINNLNSLNLNYYLTSEVGSITFNFNKGTFSSCNP